MGLCMEGACTCSDGYTQDEDGLCNVPPPEPCPDPSMPLTGMCTDLSSAGLGMITADMRTGTLPSPEGGTLREGTYRLTAVAVYDAMTTANTFQQQLWRITECGTRGAGSFVLEATLAGGDVRRSLLQTSGTMMNENAFCPAVAPVFSFPYSVTPTGFDLLFEAGVFAEPTVLSFERVGG